jgi:hypothetical protein
MERQIGVLRPGLERWELAQTFLILTNNAWGINVQLQAGRNRCCDLRFAQQRAYYRYDVAAID